jgi:hypothetical protein
MSRNVLFVALLLAAGVVLADEVPENERAAEAAAAEEAKTEDVPETESVEDSDTAQAPKKEAAKMVSGMSILGNQEAPKSLVIVPWKSSVLGDSLGISTMLDDSRQPIDREVFMRALNYYEIRSETKP